MNSFLEDSDFALIAEFDTAAECVAAADEISAPEIIIFISSGSKDESEQAVDVMINRFDDVRIMVLSAELSVDELGACLRVGARGYLLSSISKEALMHSITLVLLGETVFPSGLANAWISGGLSRRRTGNAAPVQNLTNRESDILSCLTEGSPNKLIARQLGITEATVKIHMKSLIRKIGVQNRTQAALWAIESGFADNFAPAAA
ncbi:MAG: response regulator transcription factor [Alphaproteobacteria bacterium]|nr:response regulator transcription factor [Alphaproteobacteria bacterium]